MRTPADRHAAAHSGAGEAAVRRSRRWRPVDLLQRRPYVTLQNLLDATQPKGRRYYWKSEYLPGIEPDLLVKQQEHAGRIGSPHSAVIVFQLGGAIASRPDDHSAVGNRDAAAVLNIAASWEKPEDDAANVEWARFAVGITKPTGGTYVNFLTEEETKNASPPLTART
jgi:hypothetical protein